MEAMTVNGLKIYYPAEERRAAEIIQQACEHSIQVSKQMWGIQPPPACRIYVMTSWFHFVFHSAPWPWRILLGITLPLWFWRVKSLWIYTGGWTQRYRGRPAVGVKPPRLMQIANKSIGQRIFMTEDNVEIKVQQITCHELVHAFTAHLKLPMWLNEGLAMVTVDRFAGKPTVQPDTIMTLKSPPRRGRPARYRDISINKQDEIVYHYVRGYWLTRYLTDTKPELLLSLLAKRLDSRTLESQMAAAYGLKREEFWHKIDGIVVAYFEKK